VLVPFSITAFPFEIRPLPPQLSTTPEEFHVKARMVGKRIDAYLASRYQDFSRSVIQKVIDAGAVLINGSPTKASYKVRLDDLIRVWLPDLGDDTPTPEDIPLDIIFEDEAFVVVNKPPGMVVHPAKGHWAGTLVNALQFHFDKLSSVGGEERPGIVHRLDRDTSGLILIAKDDRAHKELARQFENRTIKKEYLAIVSGAPSRDTDYVNRPIGTHPTHREKMAIRLPEDGGKEAMTYYEVIERFPRHAYVRCLPRTGRTHQIRVHLTHIGHPVLADKLYGSRANCTLGDVLGSDVAEADRVLLSRQALHAHRLTLLHPLTGAPLEFVSKLPDDMTAVLDALHSKSGTV
jgi:23S rRNA pseudouridine1911/1915/1917 synthase